MYLPTYTITNLILDYIVKAELSVKKITETPIPYKYKSELYQKIRADDLVALGDLIGTNISFTKAFDILNGKILITTKSKYKIFNNFRSTHDFVKSYNSAQFIPPSMQLMIHINKLVMNQIIDEWETGRIKTFSEKPNEIFDTWYKSRDFYPDLDVIKYFNSIFDWIINPKTKIHKLIQTGALLYEIIDKAPFFAGNQVTAILSISTILKEYGYNPDNLVPVSKAINYLGTDLLEAHKISKTKNDLTVFIEAFLYALSLEILNSETQLLSVVETKVKRLNQFLDKFNNRQIKILDYLQTHKIISRREYTKIMGISFMTSYRDLQQLVEDGFLKIKGNRRGTYYELNTEEYEKTRPVLPIFVDDSLSQ